jgi:3-methylcrotonyl-CoA carboxylase alpha subunit
VLFIIEAMKMENEVRAPHAGTVTQLSVTPGAAVTIGQVLAVVSGSAGV